MDENLLPIVINTSRRKIKISKNVIFVILLVLSISLNIFLIIKPNITGNVASDSFKHIQLSLKEPIDSNIQSQELILHYNGLSTILKDEINRSGFDEKVGIFVQDAKTGAWAGINERDGFTPASLLKLPIMIAIFKKVERGEIEFDDKITLIEGDLEGKSGELYKKEAGTKISIAELVREMIINSDNTAKNALGRQLSLGEIDAIFVHAGVPNPYVLDIDHVISPRNYMRFFKALYFSTFLSPELSERALDLTTDTKEESLISGGVPYEIQVAHKFGITDSILHDCGIIYHPLNPYFLCVMTENTDSDRTDEREIIQKISKDVYDFVDSKAS